MCNKDALKVEKLEQEVQDYINSGIPLTEYIRKHVTKEFSETGNEKLASMAEDYFLEKFGCFDEEPDDDQD